MGGLQMRALGITCSPCYSSHQPSLSEDVLNGRPLTVQSKLDTSTCSVLLPNVRSLLTYDHTAAIQSVSSVNTENSLRSLFVEWTGTRKRRSPGGSRFFGLWLCHVHVAALGLRRSFYVLFFQQVLYAFLDCTDFRHEPRLGLADDLRKRTFTAYR